MSLARRQPLQRRATATAARRRASRRFARNASDERALAAGCWFDQAAAAHACEFFPRFLRHTRGEWAGEPFELLAWQRDELIAPLFGWRSASGARRFRLAYVEIPKKNGKSTLAAGIALYLLAADGEPGANVYGAAVDREQALIVYEQAARMVEASPELSAALEVHRYTHRITHPQSLSLYQVLSAEVEQKEGLDIHGLIYDEFHVADARMFAALRYGFAARRQPLCAIFTTAGWDRESLCWHVRRKAQQVRAGEIEDHSFFGLICAADPEDEPRWTEPAVWRKANPSLGQTISEESFAADCRDAQQMPQLAADFKRYRLNLWVQQRVRWIDLQQWDACPAPPPAEQLAGRECFGGLDLANRYDVAALALVFPWSAPPFSAERPGWVVLPRFWIPRECAVEREARDHVPYRHWADLGLVTLTDGDVVDYGAIEHDIRDAAARYRLRRLGFDPYNATQMAQQLTACGIETIEVPQTTAHMNEATRTLGALIREGRIAHGGHRVLRAHAENVEAPPDRRGNIRPLKPRESDGKKIDGITALVNALVVALKTPPAPGSVYESRGLLRVDLPRF